LDAKHRARQLRRDQTDAERLLWGRLRDRRLNGFKWRRQVPKGGYVLDFYCVDQNLAVELDGGQHAEPEGLAYDTRRTVRLAADGVRVLRFWNSEVFENLEGVCETILAVCEGRL